MLQKPFCQKVSLPFGASDVPVGLFFNTIFPLRGLELPIVPVSHVLRGVAPLHPKGHEQSEMIIREANNKQRECFKRFRASRIRSGGERLNHSALLVISLRQIINRKAHGLPLVGEALPH